MTAHEDEHGILRFFIPEGLDYINGLLILITIGSGVFQLLYIISPEGLRKIFERLDYTEAVLDPNNPKVPIKKASSIHKTTIIAVSFLLAAILFLLQSFQLQDRENGGHLEDRIFRNRAIWTNQTYQYQCTLISIFWFGIKILFDVNRKHRAVNAELKDLLKDKDATAKKND